MISDRIDRIITVQNRQAFLMNIIKIQMHALLNKDFQT